VIRADGKDAMTERRPDAEALMKLLGLARRAGKLALGAEAVTRLVDRGKRPLVIVASDAGDGQAARYARLSPVRAVWNDVVDRAALAQALGRGDLAVVAIDDPGFLVGLGFDPGSESRRARRSRDAGEGDEQVTNRQTVRAKRGGR
jgi:ribosomal protein L7Ae-like RNA K-turn-binding protein